MNTPTPIPANQVSISLCLSGGGYRAALFHLGALTWLNESGLLARVDKINSVSGGSIVAGHLAVTLNTWPTGPLSDADWRARVVDPFRAFVANNIRTGPLLARLWPKNWFDSASTVEAVREKYIKLLFGGTDHGLDALPDTPEFNFCATDMVFGVNWIASRSRVGDYEAGYAKPPPAHWTLARAIAASSCFPPVFPPARTHLQPAELRGGNYREDDRDTQVAAIRLTDGGVYDNLGLQPAFRDPVVLVSDGGGQLRFTRLNLPWRRIGRYPALLQEGIGKLRKQWLMIDYNRPADDPSRKLGTYWGIAGYPDQGMPVESKEIARLIAGIRTDLNPFTPDEADILINHGYLRAYRQIADKAAVLLPSLPPAPALPYPKWSDPDKVKEALRLSHKRHVMLRERRSRVD